jgi:hypothetical protein
MLKPTKLEVLAAANSAMDVSLEFINIASTFLDEADVAEFQWAASQKLDPNGPESQKHAATREFMLGQAVAYNTAGKQYLKDAKRLTRKARWMRSPYSFTSTTNKEKN